MTPRSSGAAGGAGDAVPVDAGREGAALDLAALIAPRSRPETGVSPGGSEPGAAWPRP